MTRRKIDPSTPKDDWPAFLLHTWRKATPEDRRIMQRLLSEGGLYVTGEGEQLQPPEEHEE